MPRWVISKKEGVMKTEYAAPSVSGQTYIYQLNNGYQALVIVFTDGRVHFATRRFATDTWSPPISAEITGRF